MNKLSGAIPKSLERVIHELDTVFSQDRGSEMGAFFAEDACLQWPSSEDIVGREQIRLAFEQLVATFTTLSWKPKRSLELFCDGKAVFVGNFIEDRKLKENNIKERVYGRIVEIWSESEDGKWVINLLMTSRYAETETIP
jgi:ketosteroid isomerase-like protein